MTTPRARVYARRLDAPPGQHGELTCVSVSASVRGDVPAPFEAASPQYLVARLEILDQPAVDEAGLPRDIDAAEMAQIGVVLPYGGRRLLLTGLVTCVNLYERAGQQVLWYRLDPTEPVIRFAGDSP